uniref:Glycosyltransferase n=1 Tax=Picea glauca TaxID=3330 RepID=A0A223PIL7_PICGL|nr:UDP-glycosyltransferase UGT5 [Picea glauca]
MQPCELGMGSRKPHVAIFPSAGMGHLIPSAEFAKRLSADHGFTVTFITCKWMFSGFRLQQAYSERIASLRGFDVRFVQLPHVEIEEEAQHMKVETLVSKLLEKSKGFVESALTSLQIDDSFSPLSAFITDFFCSTMFDVTAKLHIPTYLFFTSPASLLSVMLCLPKLASETQVSFKDADFSIEVAGVPPIPAKDLPTPVQDRSDEVFYWFVHHSSRLREATGILLNTFEELESEQIKALREGKVNPSDPRRMPHIYPVGPLISSSPVEYEADCLKWLDNQAPSSVLFVSFGSGVVMSREQITELALGLDASGHRFLWVLRSPSSTFLSINDSDVSELLPQGFEDRCKDRGVVVPSWAPQIPILSHPSTRGFLSHCGWNSSLESISHGVPMIAWPVFAEQKMNKILLVNDFKVALEAKMDSDGFVKREEVERAVRELMEGEAGMAVRERTRELKEKAASALAEGGSSYKAMADAVSDWGKHAANSAATVPDT